MASRHKAPHDAGQGVQKMGLASGKATQREEEALRFQPKTHYERKLLQWNRSSEHHITGNRRTSNNFNVCQRDE